MSLEESFQKFIADQLSKRQPEELKSVPDFCKEKKISRVTLWRAEKRGEVKLTRIGRRVFINTNQFAL